MYTISKETNRGTPCYVVENTRYKTCSVYNLQDGETEQELEDRVYRQVELMEQEY